MKKTFIFISVSLCCLFFTAHLAQADLVGDSPEIRGDDRYVGDFAGFRGNKIQIDLERTGYRVSLPLADDVEYLHKDSGYRSYDPSDIPPEAPVKAIEVDGEIVQVILLWLVPR